MSRLISEFASISRCGILDISGPNLLSLGWIKLKEDLTSIVYFWS